MGKRIGVVASMVTSSLIVVAAAAMPTVATADDDRAAELDGPFHLAATYTVTGSAPEVLAPTPDGRYVAYTDAAAQEVGVFDLSDPSHPVEAETLATDLWPRSVVYAHHDDAANESTSSIFRLIANDGKADLSILDESAAPPGTLDVVDAETNTVVHQFVLPGAPEDMAVSRDERYLVIAIENSRDLEVDGGTMPQGPAGSVVIVDMTGPLSQWVIQEVPMTGLAARFGDDPEPEHVDIRRGVAAVTLQENNHLVHVRLSDGAIVRHFSAGTTTHPADLTEDGTTSFTETLTAARREPDAVAWTPGGRMVTANEGTYELDLGAGEHVGGRNFTVFGRRGGVRWDVGAGLERHAEAAGRYPDDRSDERGIEPEGVDVARFPGHTYAFIGAKRGNFVAVYELVGASERPVFVQLLPTGDRPDDIVAIPERGLLLAANQGDGTISIFSMTT